MIKSYLANPLVTADINELVATEHRQRERFLNSFR